MGWSMPSNFVTVNRIRVEAHTALMPMRGRLYQQYRPDFVLRDDLENAITAESPAITEKIVRLLDEAKGGLAAHGASLTVGNFISENGTMANIRRAVEGAQGRVRFVPVVSWSGDISWPAKFVKADAEAVIVNQNIGNPVQRLVSLESKRRELNAGGRRVYEVEMLLDPIAADSAFFDRSIIERLLNQATEPAETKADFQLWGEFNPAHRYAIGADTSKCNGGNHSTSVLIDFTPLPALWIPPTDGTT
jgi:hypothetical protein